MTATNTLLRAGSVPVIASTKRSRVRVPPGASLAPVAQLAEQFGAEGTRPQQNHRPAGRKKRGYRESARREPGGRRFDTCSAFGADSSGHFAAFDDTTAGSLARRVACPTCCTTRRG